MRQQYLIITWIIKRRVHNTSFTFTTLLYDTLKTNLWPTVDIYMPFSVTKNKRMKPSPSRPARCSVRPTRRPWRWRASWRGRRLEPPPRSPWWGPGAACAGGTAWGRRTPGWRRSTARWGCSGGVDRGSTDTTAPCGPPRPGQQVHLELTTKCSFVSHYIQCEFQIKQRPC